MTARNQVRLQILNEVLAGQCPLAEAARLLEVSERHGWRLLAAYRRAGAAGLPQLIACVNKLLLGRRHDSSENALSAVDNKVTGTENGMRGRKAEQSGSR